MKLLVLNVDWDDDLGRKTGIRAPVIGREAMLHAASALALADPEEADANGMFAAVKEYDEISSKKLEYDAEEVYVAAVTGHIREGLYADNAVAHQIDEIIRVTGAGNVILVSDGGEDEHVLPILKSRAKVNGIRRVIIKQARNLEGFLALFSRLIHDEKLQRRFFIPLALLLIAAGVSVIYSKPQIFIGVGLFLMAAYIILQVFSLPLGDLGHRIAEQARQGKLSLTTSFLGFLIVVVGGYQTLRAVAPAAQIGNVRYTVLFVYTIYWWVAGAVALIIVGRRLDRFVREHTSRSRHWEIVLFFLSAATVVYAFVEALVAYTQPNRLPLDKLVNVHFMTWLFFGGFMFFTGLIAHRYFQQLSGHGHPPPGK